MKKPLRETKIRARARHLPINGYGGTLPKLRVQQDVGLVQLQPKRQQTEPAPRLPAGRHAPVGSAPPGELADDAGRLDAKLASMVFILEHELPEPGSLIDLRYETMVVVSAARGDRDAEE